MKPNESRLWQLESNKTIAENIQMAAKYYATKYDETFDVVTLRPEDRETIMAEGCCGLTLISDTQVTPGHIALARRDGK